MKAHLSPHLVGSSHGRFLFLSLAILMLSMASSSSLCHSGSYILGGVQTGPIVEVSSSVGAVTSRCAPSSSLGPCAAPSGSSCCSPS